jgi:hypothetical protein
MQHLVSQLIYGGQAAIYSFVREVFQCLGLCFLIYFAWRVMFGVTGPHLLASFLKPMWRIAHKFLRWLLKESWRLSGDVAHAVGEHTPMKYRPYVKAVTRGLMYLLVILSVCALLQI